MSVLDEIVARKRADVASRMARVSLESLKSRAVRTGRSLERALKKPGARFILECKKASPSEGLIRKKFDVAEIARAYENFADAVSVLADEPYFQGSLENIAVARGCLDAPILCKDFVVGPYQVYEARAYGADAVLLMLSVLDDETYRRCAEAAAALGMDALTEVHDETELSRALDLGARIVGVNNRDLRTLKVDLDTTRKLAKKIPDDRVVVCESGIRSHADVEALRDHTGAFLVGGTLMKAPRLDLAVRELVFGRVKICGLRSPDDARCAYESGATFGGLIFADASPRRVDEACAQEIAAAAPLRTVGVFVNDDPQRIAHLVRTLGLEAVQLHGDESETEVANLKKILPASCEVWKAVRIADGIPHLSDTADRVLLDTYDTAVRGGTGRCFDWSLLERDLGKAEKNRVVLAGGIAPDNVREAVALGCHAVDVNSGVECAPGKKDPAKIKALFEAIR
ncbi:bifunctional indole-3-glycerol-phosphate synthase TrpC/phosphoribosylanthranilate isomerase TrpF [Synergistaceae bacterium OttesenSCG-928-I11]|nr:bifunctional indole-3-glycerol-phosphate synthase TrpC/phosphoribosylanthranilate isomerase TrpF [Synergistaceae bacterium OttesenSCG-928-I11]